MATIDDLLDRVDSKYTLVHLSALRAREINNYYHSLGDGMQRYVRPLVDEVETNKPLSIAMEEIAADKIVVQKGEDARAERAAVLAAAAVEEDTVNLDDVAGSPVTQGESAEQE